MNFSNAIGGFFELELNEFSSVFHDDAIAVNSGRNALEYILRVNEYKKIYLPYYTCDVTLEPIVRLNVEYGFYYLNKDFTPKLNRIKEEDDSIALTPKDAIFRIYKDVRFSKDKLPYKTYVSAIISEGGRKNFTLPGIYLELSKNGLNLYGGVHFIEKNQLQNLREFIAENLEEFQKLINEKKFVTNFGNILGEQHKRIPKEFKELHKVEPLLANKQFYYLAKLEKEKLYSGRLISTIMRLYKIGKPFNDFLKYGMN